MKRTIRAVLICLSLLGILTALFFLWMYGTNPETCLSEKTPEYMAKKTGLPFSKKCESIQFYQYSEWQVYVLQCRFSCKEEDVEELFSQFIAWNDHMYTSGNSKRIDISSPPFFETPNAYSPKTETWWSLEDEQIQKASARGKDPRSILWLTKAKEGKCKIYLSVKH